MIIFKLKDRGEGVRQFQKDLLTAGYELPKYGADGDYGKETAAAVKACFGGDGNSVTREQWFELLERVWKLNGITHFKPKEFVCKCGKCTGLPSEGVSIPFLQKLEQIRKLNGDRPISIRSGYRCPAHNKAVGGAKNSQHMHIPVWAADILSPGVSPRDLEKICDKVFASNGVGMGGATIVHVDLRPYKARWKYN